MIKELAGIADSARLPVTQSWRVRFRTLCARPQTVWTDSMGWTCTRMATGAATPGSDVVAAGPDVGKTLRKRRLAGCRDLATPTALPVSLWHNPQEVTDDR